MKTKQITPAELVDGEYGTIVSESGETLRITSEVYHSSVMGGMIAVECSFGTLYIDDEFPITVEV